MQTYQPTTQLPPQREQGSLNSSHQNLAALKSIARCKHSNSESVHGWPGSRLANLRQAPAIRKHPKSTTLEKCVVTSYKKKKFWGSSDHKNPSGHKGIGSPEGNHSTEIHEPPISHECNWTFSGSKGQRHREGRTISSAWWKSKTIFRSEEGHREPLIPV